MTIALMPLLYAQDALEPHISSKTLEIHHGAHHKTYVDKLNAAIEGTENAGKSVEELVKSSSGGLFNNAAQTYNHGFYWQSLSGEKTEPSESLAAAIKNDFGSMDALLEALSNEAINHFASGWAWLVVDGGHLDPRRRHGHRFRRQPAADRRCVGARLLHRPDEQAPGLREGCA